MRKQLLLPALMAIGVSFSTQVSAQDGTFQCGNVYQTRKLHAEHPELVQARLDFLQHVQQTTAGGKQRNVYVIPVVFHVIHQYGSENVSDNDIYQQVDILNEDYRMLNADTADVVPVFDTVRADTQIEFRLATLDPYGNCTNGIEHIYSHEAFTSDNASKLNQWNRARYLNIWVVANIDNGGEGGTTLGYSHHPTDAVGSNFWIDGVIMISTRLAKAANPTENTLTHEIGHYLGLDHTWGGNNTPGVACGDDGVADTPITKGHWGVCPLDDDDCSAGVIENVQNYMEYSFCSNMFTRDQATFMRNVLTQATSSRSNLYTAQNHTQTGVDVVPPPTCIPVADFSVNTTTICAGESVTYKDASWRAGVTTYAWSFPGGTPATSSAANPTVTYAQSGFYPVTLTVTNAAGSNEKTIENYIYVSGNWSEFTGPTSNDFNADANFWLVQNPEDNHARFQRVNSGGKDQSPCFMLNNYKDVSNAEPHTEDWFYYSRLGGSKDYLISPAFDLSHTSNVTVSFDYAYGTKSTSVDNITEEFRVYYSTDCGETWTLRATATLDNEDILTAGYVGSSNFVPANNLKWKTQTFTYNPGNADTKTRFRFEFIASDNSSNFFFDNFNISGVLGIEENGEATGISLSPNPVATGSELSVQIDQSNAEMQLQLTDVNGALISTTVVAASNGTQTVKIPVNVAKGCYFLQAAKGNLRSTHRVIVF